MSTLLLGIIMGVALIILVIMLMSDNNSAQVDKRLARVKGQARALANDKKIDEKLKSFLRDQKDSDIALLDRFIKSALPQPDKLRARLERTGKNITLGAYVLINALTVGIAYVVLVAVVGRPPLQAGLFGLALGVLIPHLVVGMMGGTRIANFLKHFPEAIDTMVRGLRSGLPISESIKAVAKEMPEPLSTEFGRVADAVRFGQSMDDAMWEVARRIDAPEYRFMVIAMSIQRETGGNLGETLSNLAELIRKRRGLRLKIKALSSEARASAMIIGSLPFLLFAALYFLNREYINVLLFTPGGNQLLMYAAGMMALGHGIIAKMIRFEV